MRRAPRSFAWPSNAADAGRDAGAASRRVTARKSSRSTAAGSIAASRSDPATSSPLKAPRVVLAWDTPTLRRLSAGWARYVLERRYRLHGDGGSRAARSPARPRRSRRARPAAGQLRQRLRRRHGATTAGVGARRRHAGDARRRVALGGHARRWACSTRAPRCATASPRARRQGQGQEDRRNRRSRSTTTRRPAGARAPREHARRGAARASSTPSTGSRPAPTARSR